jgi:hypothetical protein
MHMKLRVKLESSQLKQAIKRILWEPGVKAHASIWFLNIQCAIRLRLLLNSQLYLRAYHVYSRFCNTKVKHACLILIIIMDFRRKLKLDMLISLNFFPQPRNRRKGGERERHYYFNRIKFVCPFSSYIWLGGEIYWIRLSRRSWWPHSCSFPPSVS